MLSAPLLLVALSTTVAPYYGDTGPYARRVGTTFSYNFQAKTLEPVAGGEVMVQAENNSVAPHYGFAPLRVSLANSGGARKIELSYSSPGQGADVRRLVELGSGERRTVYLPIPAGANYGQLTARGSGIETGGRASIYFTVAVDRAYLVAGTEASFEALVGEKPTYSAFTTSVLALPSDDLPDALAYYVGYDEVILTDRALEDLPEATRRALEAYAATGGSLVLNKVGRGTLAHLPMFGALPAEATTPDGPGFLPYGFGRVSLCDGACAKVVKQGSSMGEWPVKPESIQNRNRYGYYGGAQPGVPLLSQARAPVGRFLLIMVAFTLLIGPGSIWVAKKRGPFAVLFTIPATAAITCVSIVGYAFVAEGFKVAASTRGYTLLDSKNGRAVTIGLSALYANLSPGAAEYGVNTAVIVPTGNDTGISSDWSAGPKYDGLTPSRSYREHGTISVLPTRARLSVKDSGEALTVQNALGGRIREALVHSNGKFHKVELVSDGEEARANVVEGNALTTEGSAERFGRDVAIATRDLPEGYFVAVVEGPGLVPSGGIKAEHEGSWTVIRGEVTK